VAFIVINKSFGCVVFIAINSLRNRCLEKKYYDALFFCVVTFEIFVETLKKAT
jgi:hypothetical protein